MNAIDDISISTTWKIYTQTSEAVDAMLKACEMATESIYFEQFVFRADAIGQKFMDLFVKKAESGVTVKCLFDAIQSIGFANSDHVQRMRDAGVKVKFFNWLTPYSEHSKKILFFRNHRRSLIVDRKKFFTGGVCIAESMNSWRETQIELEGKVVDQATLVFDQTWKRVYKKHTMQLGTQLKTGSDGFSYITHAPLPMERHLYHRLIEAVRQSSKRICLTTPYFLPDNKLLSALVLASHRGVDVQLLIPRVSNHPIVDIGAATYFKYILSKGVKIFFYDKMLHAKTALIDDDWAMIGSLNLDNISLRYNFESAVITTEKLCVGELEEIFREDLKHSHELTLEEWSKRSLAQRIAEIVVWPIRKFL